MKSVFYSMRKTGSVRSAAQEAAQKKWQEAGAKSHKKSGVSGFQAHKDAALHKAVSRAKGPAIVGQTTKGPVHFANKEDYTKQERSKLAKHIMKGKEFKSSGPRAGRIKRAYKAMSQGW